MLGATTSTRTTSSSSIIVIASSLVFLVGVVGITNDIIHVTIIYNKAEWRSRHLCLTC